MKTTTLEPGIIKTFRVFTGVRFAMFAFTVMAFFVASGWSAGMDWALLTLMLLDAGLLLVYLSLTTVRQVLKSAYLPIAIVWATIGPMVQMHLVFSDVTNNLPDRAAFMLVLQPILVTFIPLVITSWQYSMRAVILYAGLTFLFDNLLALLFSSLSGHSTNSVAVLSPVLGVAFLRTVLFLLLGNMIANLMEVQREQNRRLTAANERLAHYAATVEQLTISRERNRMARELHDVLAHTMSGVAVEMEGVRAMLHEDPEHAEALLGQSLRAVREGLGEVRRALQALRASPLEDLGLGLAIRNLAESIAGRSGLQTDVRIDPNLPDYPIEVQQSIYRVAQEALTNVVNHAQASRVQVYLLRDGPTVKLTVCDDGVGFDEMAVDINQKYGLLGIRERVEMIHGNLSIVSQAGSGTQLLLTYQTTPTEVLNDGSRAEHSSTPMR